MANAKQSKFWLLDSAGLVTQDPVFVKNVQVTFKVASAGTLELAEVDNVGGVRSSFCYAASLGATSAGQDNLTQIIPIDNWVAGVQVVTISQVAKCIINTG